MPLQTFEEVLSLTGWGLYNQFALFICASCCFCSTLAITTVSFVLPAASIDLNLNETELLWIYAALPLGIFVGGIFFGLFSDIISRRCVISSTLIILFICSFSYGFVYDSSIFIFVNFILGCSAIPNIITSKVYLSEILQMESRGYYLATVELYSILGYLISSCINWAIRAREDVEFFEFKHSWRLMFGLPTCLSICIVCVTGILQPSPRELLSRNSIASAQILLKYIFAINTSNHAENFKLSLNEIRSCVEGKSLTITHVNKCAECLLRLTAHVLRMMHTFNKTLNFKCLIFVSIIRCFLCTGYSMSNIWLVKTLHKNISTPDCKLTSVNLVHLPEKDENMEGFKSFIPVRLFHDYFILGFAMFLGVFTFCYIVDKIGRRTPLYRIQFLPLVTALVCAGISCILLTSIKTISTRLALSMIFMMGFGIANTALDIIIIESLPTSVRATGLTITHLPSAILSIISRLVINVDCKSSFYTMGAMTLIASGFTYFLPELKTLPMVE